MPSKESSQDTKQAISCLQTLLAIIAVIVGAIAIGFLVTSLDFQHAENGLWILFGIGLVFFMLVSVVIKRKQKNPKTSPPNKLISPKMTSFSRIQPWGIPNQTRWKKITVSQAISYRHYLL